MLAEIGGEIRGNRMGNRRASTTRWGAVVALAVGVLLLAGCTAAPTPSSTPTSTPTSTPDPASSDATPTPTSTPGPTIHPGDSAAANKDFFDLVNQDFYTAHGMSDGRSIIDNLVAAGFRKQDMSVTADATAIGLPVDSIVFAVRVKGECLVGQFSATGYHGEIAPLLGTGGCLIGFTRPIDW